MAASVLARITDVLEPILLREAERAALGYGDARGRAVRRHAAAARSRLAAAQELTGPASLAGAFALLREAASLATSAVVAARAGDAGESREPSATLSPSVAHEHLLSLMGAAAIPALPAVLVDVARALSPDDPLSADDLRADQLPSAKAYVSWLLDLVEARSSGELRVQRALRLGAVTACVLLASAVVLALRFSAKNLAEGRRVTASSLHAGFDTRAIVDGKRSKPLGYESNIEPNFWIQIDLGDHF
jgi:hypothetical protein